jgi:hypothetical protein
MMDLVKTGDDLFGQLTVKQRHDNPNKQWIPFQSVVVRVQNARGPKRTSTIPPQSQSNHFATLT